MVLHLLHVNLWSFLDFPPHFLKWEMYCLVLIENPRDVCCFLFEVFTLFPWFDGVSHAVTSSREADQIRRGSGATSLHAAVRESRKKEEMAIHNYLFAVRLAFVVALAFLPADVSAESTKTVELDIRPGGTVYTSTERIVRNFYPSIYFMCTITLCFSRSNGHIMQSN